MCWLVEKSFIWVYHEVMVKKSFFKIGLYCASVLSIMLLSGCDGKKSLNVSNAKMDDELPVTSELTQNSKHHWWYYFTDNSIEEIDLPQNVPERQKKAWTEAVRIASAASVPSKINPTDFDAYGIVNKIGVVAFKNGNASIYEDVSMFSKASADTIVFSETTPVFYLYRNKFFNDEAGTKLSTIQESRTVLVEYDPVSKVFYPLVSYDNLNLKDNDEITGFFWNGSEWACSVKTFTDEGVEFSYFAWTPLISITELVPSFSKDKFVFSACTEDRYRWLNFPRVYSEAPKVLKELLSYIPESVTFYVSYRDESGTSPISYYQEGSGDGSLNAKALVCPSSNIIAAVFEDGTTYIKKNGSEKVSAFRLPKLPGGFKYGDLCISGNYLIVSWEETEFFNTGKSGFIKVDLLEVLKG